MIKLYICCLVLIIGSVEVGPDIDMKFHQEVMEIVSYDIYLVVVQCIGMVGPISGGEHDASHLCDIYHSLQGYPGRWVCLL